MIDAPAERDGDGPWAKLRRRKVVQWGILYAAGAWGFLQGLEYVTDTFQWPGRVQQLTTLALLVGLPIVLVTSWYHGDKGQQRVSAAELVIITLLFLVGGGIFWRYDRVSEAPDPAASVPSAVVPATPSDIPDKSIAVLPAYSNRLTPRETETRSLDAAQRALVLDPTQPEPYLAMGSIAGVAGRRQTATVLLRRAIELRPSSATAHQWLGTVLVEMGELEQGIASLERAAGLDPRSLIVSSNLSSMLQIAGRDEESIAACLPALEYAPDAILCTAAIARHSLAAWSHFRSVAGAIRPAATCSATSTFPSCSCCWANRAWPSTMSIVDHAVARGSTCRGAC